MNTRSKTPTTKDPQRKHKAGKRQALNIQLSCCDISQKILSARTLIMRRFPNEVLAAVFNKKTEKLIEYCHSVGNPKYRETWQKSYSDEVGRVAQGMPGRVKGTDTIFFI